VHCVDLCPRKCPRHCLPALDDVDGVDENEGPGIPPLPIDVDEQEEELRVPLQKGWPHFPRVQGPHASGGVLRGQELFDELELVWTSWQTEQHTEAKQHLAGVSWAGSVPTQAPHIFSGIEAVRDSPAYQALCLAVSRAPATPAYLNPCRVKKPRYSTTTEVGGVRWDQHFVLPPMLPVQDRRELFLQFIPPLILLRELVAVGGDIRASDVLPTPETTLPIDLWLQSRARWASAADALFPLHIRQAGEPWDIVPGTLIISPDPAPATFGCWCVEYKHSAHLQHWDPALPAHQVRQLRLPRWYVAAARREEGRTPPLHRVAAVLDGFCAMHEGAFQLRRPDPQCVQWEHFEACWASDPAVITSRDLRRHSSSKTCDDGVLQRVYSDVGCFLRGGWLAVDEGLIPGCPWAGASIVAADGTSLQLATPGTTTDANLLAWLVVMSMPEARDGSIPVIYDAESPIMLLSQVSRALPGHAFKALFGRFGPRLGLAVAAMRDADRLCSRKVNSHTVGRPNGAADGKVAAPIRAGDDRWALPKDCVWVPRVQWPLEWVGLYRACGDCAVGTLLKNWERPLMRSPWEVSGTWKPRGAATERLIMHERASADDDL
jgi:hypothetical protein